MKLKTHESFSQVSLRGFSVTLSSRSQPPLRDAAEAAPADQAGSTASPPAPPKVEQRGWFRKQGELLRPIPAMMGCPGSLQVPDFDSLPIRCQGGSPALSRLHWGCSRDTQGWHLAHKTQNAAGQAAHSPLHLQPSLLQCPLDTRAPPCRPLSPSLPASSSHPISRPSSLKHLCLVHSGLLAAEQTVFPISRYQTHFPSAPRPPAIFRGN